MVVSSFFFNVFDIKSLLFKKKSDNRDKLKLKNISSVNNIL